jgi:ABC-type Mn2+/Zn2+ transport system permease subunit
MVLMSEQAADNGMTPAARMGRAIIRGVVVGVPLSIVGIALAVWLMTDLDIGDAIATALLPGVLFGGFAGGFAGVAATMD